MDNIRAVIKNLFCHIAASDIIEGQISFNHIPESIFFILGSGYQGHYSNDEIHNMYHYMENEFQWQKNRLLGTLPGSEEEKFDVFDALMAFNYSILSEENGEPVCQYQHLLRWRDMITVLEEDLFITSYLAMQDTYLIKEERQNFFWKPVIGHNNFALNKLVSQGVAENHFHLKGSAPTFHLSWISIMNQVDNDHYARQFQKYDRERLQMNISYRMEGWTGSYVAMWRMAALLRLFLFAKISDIGLDFGKASITVHDLKRLCTEQEDQALATALGEDYDDGEIRIVVDDYQSRIPLSLCEKIRMFCAESVVDRALKEESLLEEYGPVIQSNINLIKDINSQSVYDYTFSKEYLVHNVDGCRNEIISGERWFMYQMFRKVYSKDPRWEKYSNWFYLYLILKTKLRMEMVQANKTVGFGNFLSYEHRKDVFIENTKYEPAYIRMAVRDTILNQHITSLEARIAPKDTYEKLRDSIEKYDRWICEGLESKKQRWLKDKYFYVFHFIKEKDDEQEGVCRHYRKRQDVRQQARAIAKLRNSMCEETGRVRGIDAASEEIICRPEVFAQAFRFLKYHDVSDALKSKQLKKKKAVRLESLMATYHAGEDFLDVIDGMRAIDEAIYFLNLRCGDRLGHALALGIDIDEWYENKAERILISKQAYMDNLVWLYGKIRKYNLVGCEDAKMFIEKRFSEYFHDIYLSNITSDECRAICERAAHYYETRKTTHAYKHENFNFGINEYFEAWKLRGDAPELYCDGYLKLDDVELDAWQYHAINHIYPQNYRLRYVPEVSILYHMYHYNEGVKHIGKQIIEVRVKKCIIEATKMVRKVMQQEIARLGIAIETNPSSNYLIGSFRRYDKHPVRSWYNTDLTYDPKELAACPQMQVSINTDDQGVFRHISKTSMHIWHWRLRRCRMKMESIYIIVLQSCVGWIISVEWASIRALYIQTFFRRPQ